MGLKARDQVKTVFGTSPLSLVAGPGESHLVKGIKVFSAAGVFLTIRIEKTTVGFFRIGGPLGNHLAFPRFRDTAISIAPHFLKNLLDFLSDLGIFKGYPIAEGETMIISGAEGSGDIKSVIYDIYDAEDQKNTAPNGSRALEYMLINYGDTGSSISATGDNLYARSLTPVEFPSFPFADDVPAKHQILVHGILGSEQGVRNATPATAIFTRYLKLVKDREVLFDEDRNGIPFDFSTVTGGLGTYVAGGNSYIGNYSQIDPRPPLLFSEPLLFEAGDELNVYSTSVELVDGSSITTEHQVIGFIETIKRLAAT